MNTHGNYKSKEKGYRNKGPGAQAPKVNPSSDNAKDISDDSTAKANQPDAVHGEADSHQQSKTRAKFDTDVPAAAIDSAEQSMSNNKGSETRASGSNIPIDEDDANDEDDELEAEKARRHDEPSSNDKKPEVGQRP